MILERGGGREAERERNIDVRETCQSVASLTCLYWRLNDLRVCPDGEFYLPPFRLKGSAPTN